MAVTGLGQKHSVLDTKPQITSRCRWCGCWDFHGSQTSSRLFKFWCQVFFWRKLVFWEKLKQRKKNKKKNKRGDNLNYTVDPWWWITFAWRVKISPWSAEGAGASEASKVVCQCGWIEESKIYGAFPAIGKANLKQTQTVPNSIKKNLKTWMA